MEPLVSIIIITYQDREHVCEAVDSAQAQTYSNCEIILMDDGSTDGTGDMIRDRYGETIQYLWKENGGMGSARQAGFERAKGKYIQFLDSDDVLLPGKILAQVGYLEENPDVAFVYSPTVCFFANDVDERWEWPYRHRYQSGNLLLPVLRDGNFIITAAPLYRKAWLDRIGGIDPSLQVSDDFDTILRLSYAGARAHFLEESPGFLYRVREKPTGTGHRAKERFLKGQIRILKKIKKKMLVDKHPYARVPDRQIARIRVDLGWEYVTNGNIFPGLKELVCGLSLNPAYLFSKFGVDLKNQPGKTFIVDTNKR